MSSYLLNAASRLYLHVRRSVESCIVERALARVSLELAATTQQLEDAEAALLRRDAPQANRVDIQSDVIDLRGRYMALEDEWAYCMAARGRLNAGHKGV